MRAARLLLDRGPDPFSRRLRACAGRRPRARRPRAARSGDARRPGRPPARRRGHRHRVRRGRARDRADPTSRPGRAVSRLRRGARRRRPGRARVTGAPEAVLEGRRVRLRPVTPGDYEWLYQLNSLPELAHRWRGRPGSITPAQLPDSLWNNVFCQFVVCRRRDGRPVGLVVAHGADLPNRTVRFGIVLDPQYHSVGWPLEAGALFIDYLFDTGDFRK